MPFKFAYWVEGFPELEDAVIGGTLTGDSYTKVSGLPAQHLSGTGIIRAVGDSGPGLSLVGKADVFVVRIDVTHSGTMDSAALSSGVLTVTLGLEIAPIDITVGGTNPIGALRVTPKTGTDVTRIRLRVQGNNNRITFADGFLDIRGRSGNTNLNAIKSLIDGLAGTPFTTAYVGGAMSTDAVANGTREIDVPTTSRQTLGDIKAVVDGMTGTPFTTAYVDSGAAATVLELPASRRTSMYEFDGQVVHQPLMVELTAAVAVRLFRGASAPTGDTASILVPATVPLRFEHSNKPGIGIWLQRTGNANVAYSLRVWRRE